MDAVLQHARHTVVVLGGGDEEGVARPRAISCCRTAARLSSSSWLNGGIPARSKLSISTSAGATSIRRAEEATVQEAPTEASSDTDEVQA